MDIAHMDIKLDNILLDKHFNVKIADLGVALDVSKTDGMSDSRRGTPGYMAPEVCQLLPGETYEAKNADIFSLGVALYMMIFGEKPIKVEQPDDSSTYFDSDTLGAVTGLKCSDQTKTKWGFLPEELQLLLGSMLSLEAEDRPTLEEILESEWIQDAFHEEMPMYFYKEMTRKQNQAQPQVCKQVSEEDLHWMECQLDNSF
jgi:serine/threonine protein kinase